MSLSRGLSRSPSSDTPVRQSVVVHAGAGREDAFVFASLGVDADVELRLYMRRPDDDTVSILMGHERVRLEFFDVESLRRIRDLADEGIRRLQAATAVSA